MKVTFPDNLQLVSSTMLIGMMFERLTYHWHLYIFLRLFSLVHCKIWFCGRPSSVRLIKIRLLLSKRYCLSKIPGHVNYRKLRIALVLKLKVFFLSFSPSLLSLYHHRTFSFNLVSSLLRLRLLRLQPQHFSTITNTFTKFNK